MLLDTDAESTPQREISSKLGMSSKMMLASSHSESAADGEGDSGFMGHTLSRLPGNGTFPVGNLPLSTVGEPAMFSGQMISPTHPQGPVQYMQPQVRFI